MAIAPPFSNIARGLKLRYFSRFCAPGSTALDVGSGDGWFSRGLRDHGVRCTTLDITEEADVRGDIREWKALGLQKESFDAVIAFEVVEHVDCLEALRDLLKPGGVLLLTTPVPGADPLLKALEALRLTQPRVTPHAHLRSIHTLSEFDPVSYRRIAGLSQWAVHRKIA